MAADTIGAIDILRVIAITSFAGGTTFLGIYISKRTNFAEDHVLALTAFGAGILISAAIFSMVIEAEKSIGIMATLFAFIGVAIIPTLPSSPSKSPLSQCLQYTAFHTLEGYVLPLLPQAPLFIHNMHFKTKVLPECYSELDLPSYKGNNGKYHPEIIGKTKVDYVFYSSGTVDIYASCSNNPYRLETEEDRFRIVEFFGQIRAGLINLLNDKHERIVDDVLEWELTECDINRDIKVSDLLHFSAIKVQVKHLDHLFSIYIKSIGKDTVCRVEERKHPNQSAIEFINDIFNPVERVEKQVAENTKKVDKLTDLLEKFSISQDV